MSVAAFVMMIPIGITATKTATDMQTVNFELAWLSHLQLALEVEEVD